MTLREGHALHVEGAAGPLLLVSYRAAEALSELSRFDVDAGIDGGADTLDALLGARATLTLDGDPSRTIAGLIARTRLTAARLEDGRPVARLRLLPRLWLLSRGSDTRVFQDLAVPEIVAEVLSARGIPARFELARKHFARPYAVQYEESDYAFVARLAAEEGLFFWFEDGAEGTVVFADAPAHYPPIASTDGRAPVLRLREDAELGRGEGAVRAFSTARAVRAGRVVRSDYDPLRPAFAVTAEAAARDAAPIEAALEVYDPRTEYDAPALDRHAAEARVAAERSRAAVSRGETTCRAVAPGRRFALEGHPEARENGEHVIVRVRHEGFVPHRSPRDGGRRETFRCRFEAVRADVLYRPPPVRRPPTQVVESAVVVGPPGEDVFTDELGRVRVQFHWDRKGKADERSSCWLRVMTPWAGNGWGVQCVPRVGMEVLVSFLGGDPDRPVVLGALVNETHPPPFLLPRDRTKTGIRTRSSPAVEGSSGYNELSFEDARGRERLVVRAERDLVTSAEQDHHASVGRDRRSSVRGDAHEEIQGARTTRVRGASHVDIGGDHAARIAGDARTTVSGAEARSVGGALAESVGAGLTRVVGGGVDERMGGDHDVVIAGSASRGIARDAGLRVGGHLAATVGTHGSDSAATDSGDASLRAKRDVTLTSGGAVRVAAATSISLSVGGARLEIDDERILVVIGDTRVSLTPEELAIAAKVIAATAKQELVLSREQTALVLDDGVHVGGDEVHLHALGASLVLGTEAVLRGGQVKLQRGHGTGPRVAADEPPKKAPTETELRLILKDPSGDPYANKTYVLTVDGRAFPPGRTGGDGAIKETVAAGAVAGTVLVTVDDEHTVRIPLLFRRLPPIDSVAGVKARLRNLGYYRGPIDEALDREAFGAVRRFQERHRLEPTGAIDDATRARVAALSGI